MSFDRELWGGVFRRDDPPKFRCPNCKSGHLILEKPSLDVREPAYSVEAAKSEDWEPDWTTERFVGIFKCDRAACGEFVVMSGDTTVVEDYDEEHGWGLLSVLRPRSLCPAPPIIDLPVDLPREIAKEVKKSFELFWSDLSACANRLRTSVERLLDHFKVPDTALNKRTNKPERLDLNGRIAIFERQDKDTALTLTALRMIGNLGSHGDEVSRRVLLDAYELYEDCLSDVFGNRKQRMQAIKQKIIQAKGKY